MTRELLLFFAPPKKLARAALIATGISSAVQLLHWDVPGTTALAIWLGWWLSGCFGHIAIQPISCWDSAWPVPQRLLLRTRILAAWLASGVPSLGPVIAASVLRALGVIANLAWAGAVARSICILGLVPIACALGYRLSDRKHASPGRVLGFIFFPTLLLDTMTGSRQGAAPSLVSVLLVLALSFALLATLAGLLLTRVWLQSAGLEASPAREHAPSRARAGASALGKSGILARLSAQPVWFFYRHSLWQAGLYLVFFGVLVSTSNFRVPGTMWFLATMFWFQTHSGSLRPSPLPAHLPISRGRILGYLLTPLAVLLALGLALEQRSHHLPSRVESGRYYQDLGRGDYTSDTLYRILVPTLSWRASWGEPPLVTAPGGVARHPAAFTVIPGLPLNVYNPYDARLDDDPAFVNYQVSRVLSENWQTDVSPADVERACGALERGHMGAHCLGGELVTRYQEPGGWFAVHAWLLCWITLLLLYMQIAGQGTPSNRTRAPAQARVALLAFLGMAPVLSLAMALDDVDKNDPTGGMQFSFRLAVLLGELTRFVERAPLLSALLGLGLLIGGFLYVARIFVRMEVRGRRTARAAPGEPPGARQVVA